MLYIGRSVRFSSVQRQRICKKSSCRCIGLLWYEIFKFVCVTFSSLVLTASAAFAIFLLFSPVTPFFYLLFFTLVSIFFGLMVKPPHAKKPDFSGQTNSSICLLKRRINLKWHKTSRDQAPAVVGGNVVVQYPCPAP